MKALNWVIALLGLWEFGDILALFTPGFGMIRAFVWDHIVVGIVLMTAGTWAALTSNRRIAKISDWVATVAGAWLVIASFTLGNPMHAAGLWNDVAVGVVAMFLSVWAALKARRIAQ